MTGEPERAIQVLPATYSGDLARCPVVPTLQDALDWIAELERWVATLERQASE